MLSSFSKNNYITFLKQSQQQGFSFHRVKDFQKITNRTKNIILRHDIDLSLKYALEMARIEAKEKIYATYYVMIDGQFYNILERDNMYAIKEIQEMGHEIGLHFDSNNYQNIQHQIDILEIIIQNKVFSIAQHTPMSKGFFKINNLSVIDAYTLTNNLSNLEYISDSGMKWRTYTFENGLELEKNLYLLAHPISWLNPKNNLLSIIKESKAKEIKKREQSFNNFIKMQLIYDKEREDSS